MTQINDPASSPVPLDIADDAGISRQIGLINDSIGADLRNNGRVVPGGFLIVTMPQAPAQIVVAGQSLRYRVGPGSRWSLLRPQHRGLAHATGNWWAFPRIGQEADEYLLRFAAGDVAVLLWDIDDECIDLVLSPRDAELVLGRTEPLSILPFGRPRPGAGSDGRLLREPER